MSDGNWRKSTYSGSGGGNCIEVGETTGAVLIRDTKQTHWAEGRTVLRLTPSNFRRLTSTIKRYRPVNPQQS